MPPPSPSKPAPPKDRSGGEWRFVLILLGVACLVFVFLRFTGLDTGFSQQQSDYRYGISNIRPSRAKPIPGLPAEILVTKGHFLNSATGDNLLYEVQVVATIPNPQGAYPETLAQHEALRQAQDQINTQIADIVRKAHPERFREEGLETLRRQFRAVVNQKLRQEGLPEAEDILITKMIPIRQLD